MVVVTDCAVVTQIFEPKVGKYVGYVESSYLDSYNWYAFNTAVSAPFKH